MATRKKKKAKKKTTRKRSKSPRTGRGNRPGTRRRDSQGLNENQRNFLYAFEELQEIKAAGQAANVSRQQHYRWLDDDEYRKEYDRIFAIAEKRRRDEVLERVRRIGDPEQGWTEVIEERELVAAWAIDSDTGLRVPQLDERGEPVFHVKSMKQRRVNKFSVAATLWEANRLNGNPARLEVTGAGGGPIQGEMVLQMFRAAAQRGQALKEGREIDLE